MKEIYFCVDNSINIEEIAPEDIYLSYDETEKAIKCGDSPIYTLSLAHLSFDLLDKGYQIFLCKGDKKVKIEIKMPLSYKGMTDFLHKNCDEYLLDWFLSGWFDELLNSKE